MIKSWDLPSGYNTLLRFFQRSTESTELGPPVETQNLALSGTPETKEKRDSELPYPPCWWIPS